MAKQPCVYILANQQRGTLDIGVTSTLEARLFQHRAETTKGFSAHYGAYQLVRFEMFEERRGLRRVGY